MTGLVSVDDALAKLAQARPDFGEETVSLVEALGAVLASPVAARTSRPPADVSAMDGYAVRLADVTKPGAKLHVIGEAPAGAPFRQTVGAGEAVRIFTGGVLPKGADHIVIQEDTGREGETVHCRLGYNAPEYVRQRGRDFSEGDTLLEHSMRIGPAELAIAAAANHGELTIKRRPRVGVLANGDELRQPGADHGPGEIVNSNPPALMALIAEWGGMPADLGVASDSVQSIRKKIDEAEAIGIFLPIGGASVGDHDYMRTAFAEAGFEPIFEKVAVKPGKPTWASRRGNQLVLGLPGNPASALVCAYLFLKPLLAGEAALKTSRARLSEDLPSNGARESFLRASLSTDDTGQRWTSAMPDQDSSLIRPFLAAGALIRRKPNAEACAKGSVVDIIELQS